MRKTLSVLLVLGLTVFLVGVLSLYVQGQGKAKGKNKDSLCIKIQDGILTYSPGHFLEGQPIMPGFDPYGYNYQAHLFNGYYANAYLGRYGFPAYEGDDEAYLAKNPGAENTWVWPYRNDVLMMKWNDP